MADPAEPILRVRLHQQVADRLIELIQGGAFPPGTQLPSEHELMRRFGVGRVAVREALQLLEGMGAIAISHGERARVLEPSAARILGKFSVGMAHVLRSAPENLEYLKAARLEFEIALVCKAAGGAREGDVAQLEHRIAAMRTAGSGLAFLRADMQFHCAIAELSGNPLYPLLLEAMLDWLSAFHVAQVHVSGLEALTIAEHEAIVTAIARGDTGAAAEAVRAHLTRANALYRLHER
jgi:DNA-binding FadR family transcriptional regulator